MAASTRVIKFYIMVVFGFFTGSFFGAHIFPYTSLFSIQSMTPYAVIAKYSYNNKEKQKSIKSYSNASMRDNPFLSLKLYKSAAFYPIKIASSLVRKPLRDICFWGRALHIYSSYKIHQMRANVGNSFQLYSDYDDLEHLRRKNLSDFQWNTLHELNSKRMINLCLGLRGFYLKTGQFLGTRHDFMPKHYTVCISFIFIII